MTNISDNPIIKIIEKFVGKNNMKMIIDFIYKILRQFSDSDQNKKNSGK